jgi:phenylacetate-CoA ligase
MNSTEIIKKFLGSSYVLDRISREFFERFPLPLRYRLYYGKPFLYWMAFLEESDYWDRERYEAFQFEQLKALLNHVSQHVPYYRKLFSNYGFNPHNVGSLDDIKVLPYLTKEIVQDEGENFLAENIPREELEETYTSGSTGIPLVLYRTKEAMLRARAQIYHVLKRVDYDPKKKVVLFRGSIQIGNKEDYDILRYGNKLLLNVRNVSNRWMKKYYEAVRNFRPEFFSGHRTDLLNFALFIKEEGLPPLTGLRAALAYGETIFPWQRSIIGESFGTRVFSTYGMFESIIFGGECEYSHQYHIFPQYGITELIHRDDMAHEIVATGLSNYAMPFIRYRTMDVGVEGARRCKSCGRNHLLIERIDGRMKEYLVNRDGKMLYASLSDAFDVNIFQNVKAHQFYQDEPGFVQMKIQKGKSYNESDTELIEGEIRRNLNIPDSGIDLTLVFVDAVEKTASGKVLMTDQRLDIEEFLKN